MKEQKPMVSTEQLTPKEEADFLNLIFQDVMAGKLSEQEAQDLIDREYALLQARCTYEPF